MNDLSARSAGIDATALLGMPLSMSMEWFDANVRLIEGWLEWQRNCWQPLADLQAEWTRQWQEQVIGAAAQRGLEQLA